MKVVQNAYSKKPFLDLHEDVGNLVTGYSVLPGNSERLVYSAEQLCSSEVGELAWILKDWIMAGGINLIAGMPAAGKSFLALDLAIGIASTGFAWNDQPVPLGKVTYHFLDGSFRECDHACLSFAMRVGSNLQPTSPLISLPSVFENRMKSWRSNNGFQARECLWSFLMSWRNSLPAQTRTRSPRCPL
jgi:hypothetical protein